MVEYDNHTMIERIMNASTPLRALKLDLGLNVALHIDSLTVLSL